MSRKYLLVANPTARSGAAERRIQATLALMSSRGMRVDFLATRPEGRTVAVVREAVDAGGHDVVVYLGGDGTFAEVAKGILQASAPVLMGMLPSGTANNQGKAFGVRAQPRALERNLDVIEGDHVVRMDVGRIERLEASGAVGNTELFFDSVGFGMHPSILFSRNRDRRRIAQVPLLGLVYRDHAVYAGAMLERYVRSYLERTKFDAHVHANGRVYELRRLTDLVINNTPIYGGIWVPVREAEPDDGLFELVPLQGRRDSISKAIRDIKDLPIWQEHLDPFGIRHSEGFSASEFDVELLKPRGKPVAVQIDGEEWDSGDHFRVQVLPNRLPVLTPAGYVPPWSLATTTA